jgi:hypothetical protein
MIKRLVYEIKCEIECKAVVKMSTCLVKRSIIKEIGRDSRGIDGSK